jgi:hypothetical protein
VLIGLCELMLGAKASQVRPVEALAHFGPRPLLLVHGSQDAIISIENSRQLLQARPRRTQLHEVKLAGHNSVLSGGFFGSYEDPFLGFLEGNLLKQTQQDSFSSARLPRFSPTNIRIPTAQQKLVGAAAPENLAISQPSAGDQLSESLVRPAGWRSFILLFRIHGAPRRS